LRFSVPFNACRPRCAVRGGQASGRSRFDVPSPACDPRVREPSLTDGVLAVFRFSDAMRLCSMYGRCVACLARRRRRVKAAATRGAARSTTVCDRSCGRCSGEPMLRATNVLLQRPRQIALPVSHVRAFRQLLDGVPTLTRPGTRVSGGLISDLGAAAGSIARVPARGVFSSVRPKASRTDQPDVFMVHRLSGVDGRPCNLIRLRERNCC
jgi:hypothetical protein